MASDDKKTKRTQGDDGPSMRPGRMLLAWFAAFVCILAMIHLLMNGDWVRGQKKRSLEFDEFWTLLEKNSITEVNFRGTEAEAAVIYDIIKTESGDSFEGLISKRTDDEVTIMTLSGEKKDVSRNNIVTIERSDEQVRLEVKFPQNYFEATTWNELRQTIKATGTEFHYSEPPFPIKQVILSIAPWLLFILLIWFLVLRQMRSPGGSNVLTFGKSRARLANTSGHRLTFDDVAGVEEAKEEVRELIEFLKHPEKFQRLGGRIPRGILLVGSPGTGKTLLAKAIAGEADVPFFSISGSDFVEMFVGIGASRVRDLFRQAKEHSPCIIFLDEIDAVGRKRGAGLGGGHDEREQTLNAILVEMDGFDTDASIILIAATNRPDVLDPALLRPGRFDRQVVVDAPDVKGREAILKVHAREKKLSPDVELAKLAKSTPFFSGADLENLMNEGALLAALNGQDAIYQKDLEEAREKVQWGREKRSRVLHEDEKKVSAYHETGHALVSKFTPRSHPLHKVTIIPRGMALGATQFIPEKDHNLMSKRRILDEITVLLAGRAAEEVFLDDITSGAQNDFERSTEFARMMVCKWGMSERLGTVNYSENEEDIFLGRDFTRVKTVSEATNLEIDKEIKVILDECYKNAKNHLEEHKDEVHAIAGALLKYETLDSNEVDVIMQGGTIQRENENGSERTEEPEPKTSDDGETGEPIDEAVKASVSSETDVGSGETEGEEQVA